MLVRITFGAVLTSLALVAVGAPAQALTARECSAKYKEAQTAGTLGGLKWNEFRKAQCGDDGAAQIAAVPAASSAPNPLKPVPPASSASIPVTAGVAIFPKSVSPKYASEKAGTARRHTCRDQYQENKASGANAGLPWNKKGGGYYSECTRRLKGA
jgi:hypothetical protein